MRLLAIIPAFNEAKNIGGLLQSIASLTLTGINLDVVVINDGSQDDTSQVSKGLNLCNVNVIDLPCNLGIGGAVQTGYKYALKYDYDIAIQVDGDGQHRPEFIANIIEPIIKGEADLVIGSRYIEKKGFQSTYLRRLGINYFSKLISILVKQKVTDPTSGFRACNKKVIKLFANKYPTDFPEPESIVYLIRNKFRVKEVPVVMNERVGGVSSIHSIKAIYYMIKVSLAIIIDTLRKQTT